MLVVPRVARDFSNGLVGVNGFGFIGMLLVRDKGRDTDPSTSADGLTAIEDKRTGLGGTGPIAVLNAVTFPN